MSIENITLKVGMRVITVSEQEARQMYTDLHALFGRNEYQHIPPMFVPNGPNPTCLNNTVYGEPY